MHIAVHGEDGPALLSNPPEPPSFSPRMSDPLPIPTKLRLVQWAICPQLCIYSHKWLRLSRVTCYDSELCVPWLVEGTFFEHNG